MLMIMAITVAMLGSGRVKPSAYFRPMTQAISNRPAMNR
tara:strand:- start:1798 stop:1914 length:117 start_codon:yes stop_codon:yes gene_type:complete